MDGGGDINTKNEWGYFELPGLPLESVSPNRAYELFRIFKDNNSQFYYLREECFCDDERFYLMIYKDFAKESDRLKATRQITSAVTNFTETAKLKNNDYDVVKDIHDKLCEEISYNYDEEEIGEEKCFGGSVYSAIVLKNTQCGGYAKAFAMLCNKLGVDAVVVGSNSHGWNLVKVDDVWYELDCTWDDDTDDGGSVLYNWFLRSEKVAIENDLDGIHIFNETYSPYTPKCTKDCQPSADGLKPGIPSKTNEFVNTPNLVYENETISFTADKDSKVYFTLDGQTPMEGQGRSFLYKTPMAVEAGTVVKAIAVDDAKRDSEEMAWVLETDENGEISPKPLFSTITIENPKKTFKTKALKKKAKSFDIGAKTDGGELSYEVVEKSKKLTFDNGVVTVKKGAKKGKYHVEVKVTSAKNENYEETSMTFTIEVVVK